MALSLRKKLLDAAFWAAAVTVASIGLGVAMPACAAVAAAEEETPKGPDAARHRIPLDPFIFNLEVRGRVKGVLNLELVLEIVEDSDFEDVEQRIPQLRSDLLTAMTTLVRDRITYNTPVNPDLISIFLQPVMDRRFGRHAVNVYVANAYVDPI